LVIGIGIGVGVAAFAGLAVAAVAAIGVGGGYFAYNQHEASKQNASPTRLHVKIIAGANLKACDPNGFSDPYVVIKVGNAGAKTPVIQKSLTPRWDAAFEFGILPGIEYVDFQVFDKDRFSDDSMGKARVHIAQIARGAPRAQTLKLEDTISGDLHVELGIVG